MSGDKPKSNTSGSRSSQGPRRSSGTGGRDGARGRKDGARRKDSRGNKDSRAGTASAGRKASRGGEDRRGSGASRSGRPQRSTSQRARTPASEVAHEPRPEPGPPTPQEEWVDEGRVARPKRARPGQSTGDKGRKGPGGSGVSRKPPRVTPPELSRSVGKERAKRLEGRVEDAARAFAAERFFDARRILRPIVVEVPESPEVRELLGLTYYRLGKWRQACEQLEAFVSLTGGSVEQHPVLSDCYRALGRYDRVDTLWAELGEVSPSPELVTEGRIVTAGSLADRGRLSDGVALLAKGFKLPARHSEYHLRRAYALADLYERTGDLPQARQLFSRIANFSPDYVDVEDRLENLG